MNIDRNNYEMYFLDYLEGRLTTDETAALLLFADENPDLKALLEGEEMINLVPDETINFYPKSALKKKLVSGEASLQKINAGNYEEFMIRFYDNDLNDSEQAELANFLKDSPTYMKEFELFGTTLLKPDHEIVYAHKNRLKRNFIYRPNLKGVIAIVSVAASILLFSTLFLKYFDQPIPREHNIRLAVQVSRKIENVKAAKQAVKTAEIISTDVDRSIKTHKPTKTFIRKTITAIRTGFDVPASLIMIHPPLLPTAQISVPKSITPRLDFYGISSTAYYDPEPDTIPLNSGKGTFGGRVGQTLVQGISQTAGTIAREPELSRLLHGKISLADIARLGLAGFNLVTDSKLSISRKYDADGYLKGYTIVDDKKRAE
jgi:hypothetical protein